MKPSRKFFSAGLDFNVSGTVDAHRDLPMPPVLSWLDPTGRVWGEVFLDIPRYTIRFCNICDFRLIPAEETVSCEILAGNSILDVEHLFHNTVVPLLWSIQGESVYHASCVRVGENAIVFMGASGRGKSTLATEFALNGYPFLSDDVLPIEDEMPATACPHAASVRLWSATVDALLPPGREVEAYSTYTSKSRIAADEVLPHSTEPARIAAAFVLVGGEPNKITIRKMNGRSAHAAWLENMFLLDPTDQKVFGSLFGKTSSIAGSVPTYSLNFPRGFALLPDVRNQILDTVARCETAG